MRRLFPSIVPNYNLKFTEKGKQEEGEGLGFQFPGFSPTHSLSRQQRDYSDTPIQGFFWILDSGFWILFFHTS
jgi:hypothetical protein